MKAAWRSKAQRNLALAAAKAEMAAKGSSDDVSGDGNESERSGENMKKTTGVTRQRGGAHQWQKSSMKTKSGSVTKKS
jgi:hypothetical protein